MKSIFAFSLLILSATAAVAQPTPTASIAPLDPDSALLSLSAEGRSLRTPDLAIFSAGVVSTGVTASEAIGANSRKMEAVMDALRRAGIAARDIQTSSISLQPRFDDPDRDEILRARQSGQPYVPSARPRAPKIIGYEARNSVQVRVRKLGEMGRILDTLVESGANEVNGPSFTLDEQKAALDEARIEAVATGRARAELYARAAGMRVARIVAISEGGGYYPVQEIFVTARAASRQRPAAPAADSGLAGRAGAGGERVDAVRAGALRARHPRWLRPLPAIGFSLPVGARPGLVLIFPRQVAQPIRQPEAPERVVAPVHQRITPARGYDIDRLLRAMAADIADHFSHVGVILVPEIGRGRPQYRDDPPPAGMADALARTAVGALPANLEALGRRQPVLEFVGGHVHHRREICRDAITIERHPASLLRAAPATSPVNACRPLEHVFQALATLFAATQNCPLATHAHRRLRAGGRPRSGQCGNYRPSRQRRTCYCSDNFGGLPWVEGPAGCSPFTAGSSYRVGRGRGCRAHRAMARRAYSASRSANTGRYVRRDGASAFGLGGVGQKARRRDGWPSPRR